MTMSGSTKLGWFLINLTMLSLIIVVPWVPGLTHQEIWGGLLCAFLVTSWSVIPPPRAFSRVAWLPVYIVAQTFCWTTIWHHHDVWTLMGVGSFVASVLMLCALNTFVIVRK
jgi:hypothetical protein